MGKKNTSVWIEEEYIEELKKHGLKLSTTINQYLGTYIPVLNSSEKELFKKRQEIMDLLKDKQAELDMINKMIFKLNDDEEE